MILGVDFVPLRETFSGISKRVQSKTVSNIFVSTGGADSLHLALELIRHIVEGKKQEVYHFLLGAMNEDKKKIREIVEGYDNIIIHENISDMRSLIQSCDMAISAAGSTVYEISACGVPMVMYSLADNQLRGAEYMSLMGLAIDAGDIRDPNTGDSNESASDKLRGDAADILLDKAGSLIKDYNLRCDMGEKMQRLIDGNGAQRMVEVLRKEISH